MFNKQAHSILLRSFSNPILKYKTSTILLCFLFCSSYLDYFFLLFLFPFSSFSASSLVMSHTSHLQERSPTSIGLLFLQSCLYICLWSLKSKIWPRKRLGQPTPKRCHKKEVSWWMCRIVHWVKTQLWTCFGLWVLSAGRWVCATLESTTEHYNNAQHPAPLLVGASSARLLYWCLLVPKMSQHEPSLKKKKVSLVFFLMGNLSAVVFEHGLHAWLLDDTRLRAGNGMYKSLKTWWNFEKEKKQVRNKAIVLQKKKKRRREE